jgi:hypothetical protein
MPMGAPAPVRQHVMPAAAATAAALNRPPIVAAPNSARLVGQPVMPVVAGAVPIPQQLAPQQLAQMQQVQMQQQLAQMQMLQGIQGIQPSAMLPAMPFQSLGQPPVVMQPIVAQPQPIGPFYAQPQ